MTNLRSDACVEAVAKAIYPLHPDAMLTSDQIMDRCRYMAKAAIEALLGRLQMSREEAFKVADTAELIALGRDRFAPQFFRNGYTECLFNLGLVRDNEESKRG